jgi:hypothetical protein
MKKGIAANTIHGSASGGGGLDDKGKKANTIHGPVTTKDDCEKANKVVGPARDSAPGPKTMTGKYNKRMY